MMVLGVVFVAGLTFQASDIAQGQVKRAVPPGMAPGGPGTIPPGVTDLADKGRLTLPTDPKLKRRLEAVEDYIKSEEWDTVAKNVQDLLNLDNDVFVQMPIKGADGKPVETLVGIRIAANRLVASLPRDKPGAGLDVYKTVHGPTARKLLQDAITDGDKQKFADVAQRFLYTDAGGEGAERLATILLDRGDFMAAAQAFDRLIQRDGVEKLEPLTLFKAAVAFHKGNTKEDRDNKDKVWKQLQAKAPDGFTAGSQTITLEDAARYLERIRGGVNTSIHDWPMDGGNPSRNGQGVGDTAFMQPLWHYPLFGTTAPEGSQLTTNGDQVKKWIETEPNSVIKRLEEKGEAVIPAAVPVTATVVGSDGKPKSVLVFRTYDGVFTRELKTGKREWQMSSVWSLERMFQDPAKQEPVRTWVNQFKDNFRKPGVIIENSTVGTMSSDGGRVFFIDDLQVPPPLLNQQPDPWGRFPAPGTGVFPAQVNAGVQGNTLRCVAISSGKLLWSLPASKSEEDHFTPRNDFRDTHFLGAPLSLGGKLYFLNEKSQDIRLVCLDMGRLPERVQEKDVDEAIVWVQKLGQTKEKLLVDYGRRIHATHIAYGEGILVCPTNAGVLIAVDPLSHSLIWAHAYSNAPPPEQPNPYGRRFPPGFGPNGQPIQPGGPITSDWKATPPIIADGRVVFTAPDGPELKCLNLRNGAEIWKMKRGEDDLYLAGVYAGRVVVVAKKDIRALSLEDGRELWRVPTGMPSGRGVASDNVYYLPLKLAVFSDKEKGPGIFAIDIEHGKIAAQTRSKKDLKTNAVEVPGNLMFFDGLVISQTATELVAYPQLKVKLNEMNELLAKNANDPRGLFERGELRLDKGELVGAVEDLHAALGNNPSAELLPRAESKLFDAMTELLQRDFNNGEKYLDEYKKLCQVTPAKPEEAEDARKETQRRTANFLCLLAQGREGQGKLGEALAGYLEFGSLPTAQDELLGVVTEPAVKAQAGVWARGRIQAMLERTSADQRKPLEDVIAGKWNEVKSSGDLEKLRHFVNMFGSTVAIGKEGRLHLAERLMAREGQADMLDAEIQFLKLTNDDDPGFVARALDGLARLNTRKGHLEDAYKYYRDLKTRFPNTPVRDLKTGSQLFDDLATDKRFLQYMDEPGDVIGTQKFKAEEDTGHTFAQTPQHMLYTLDAVNEPLPYLKHLRVAVNYSTNHLKLVDRRTGDDKSFNEPLKENFQSLMYPNQNFNPNMPPGWNGQQQVEASRFGYQSVGHLVVANLGQYLVAIDPVTHRLLWDKNLLGATAPSGSQPQYNPADGTLRLLFQDGSFLTIGQGGPVEATYVCVQTRDGLAALDPLTGKILWTRSDVPLRCRLFGDDKHIYVVELDNQGVANNTRAFRAQDGASVTVPPFAALYQKRQRIIGREMLVADTLPTGGVNLRLYDVHTGQDLWAQRFDSGTVMLHSEDPDLFGAISPLGRVAIVSIRQRKVVTGAIVNPDHMKNLREAHLLADAQGFYIAFHTTNPNNPQDPWSNVQTNTGLRALTVNGEVYAYDRRTGRIRWHNDVPYQQLVLEEWKDMPVLLFTARFNPNNNGMRGFPGNNFGNIGIQVYGKTTGRLEYSQPSAGRPQLNMQSGPIYAINADVRNGKIEMIAPNYKVTITQQGEASANAGGAVEKGTKPAAQGGAAGNAGAQTGQATPALPVLPRAAQKLEILKD